MLLRRLLIPALLFVSFNLRAAVDPSLFRDLRWRNIGPFRGGRVLAVSGVPGEPEHFYFGSVNGGVWETRDAGRTWQPIFDGQPIGSVGALAVAPSDPKVIYVGSGEADMRSDISQGDGMYKSTDGGKTWSHVGLADSQQIARILIDPLNPDLVYVAALGHPYGANAERGVFRSKDGGATWQKMLGRWSGGLQPAVYGRETHHWDNDTGAVDLAFEPGDARVLYAALWQTRRTPWSVYPPSNGPGSGLFKSTDGGATWTELRGNGLPGKPGRIGIAVAPSNPRRVYLVIDADPNGGVYRSDDAGATWTRAGADARVWSRGWYFGEIRVEPKNPDVVYSMNVNVYRSEDAGKTWVPAKGAPGGDDYHALWIDPEHPERRILGVDQGCVVSVNGGRTWSSWFNQPTGQFYHVVTDSRFPYRVYGAQQDSGAAGVPSRTNVIDGINITEFHEVTAGGESDNIAPDPKDPDILYGGRVDKLDLRTRQTQSIDPTLANPGNDRRTWSLPLVFSPRDPRVLYFANQRLYRTADGGNHWSLISPDLTREDPGTPPNLDPVTAALHQGTGKRRGVIYAIAPSRLADHDLWAGTDDGQIWRTKDEGAHWTNATPAAITSWSKIGNIDASHFDADTAYAAVDRHRLDDFRPYVYRTHDGGKNWQLIAGGIADGSFVNVVREDPVRKGLLYAGTEKGMYVSFDDGDHWQSLQKNLPVTSVRDVEVHGNDVVIATHGRAFWIMDDVSPLRDPAISAPDIVSAPYLFKPAAAVRERPAGFTGSPMPKDEPMAPNPPAGAYIDYYVAPASAGVPSAPVTIEILTAAEKLVRRYSSADPVPKPNLARMTTAPEWFNTPVAVSNEAGMHRFVWPIRYPAVAGLGGRRGGGEGVWAPPGDYRVVLTVGERKLTQTLTVVPDPRLTLPPAAYAEQFALAKEIEAMHAAVRTALTEADAALLKLKPDDPLRERVVAVAGITYSPTGPNAELSTTSLRFYDAELGKLMQAVDGADAAPTDDAKQAWAKLRPLAEKAAAEWKALKEQIPKPPPS
jgi:photosystem II stability/assembly factor-like uncharacterized protein